MIDIHPFYIALLTCLVAFPILAGFMKVTRFARVRFIDSVFFWLGVAVLATNLSMLALAIVGFVALVFGPMLGRLKLY